MELPRPLNETEVVFVQSFTATAERLAKARGVYTDFDIYGIAAEAGIDVRDLPKEGILIQAIWVSFLSVLRTYLPKNEMKYQSLQDFLDAYKGQFDDCSATEMQNLLETANWMNILFRFIPAKKNKGLAIAIIPKLIEGWLTKYVTGSGQKRATADRVKIFETEGQVKPNQRGKVKPSLARHTSISTGVGAPSNKPPKSRMMKKESSYIKKKKLASMDDDNDDDDEGYGHDSALGYQLQVPYGSATVPMQDFTDTDHESSEDVGHQVGEDIDREIYDFDFEASSDLFFNHYQEAMMLVPPESAPPVAVMDDEYPGLDSDDIDFAEVLRLIRDPSTPNLRSSGSLPRLNGSPRRQGFTSPLQSQNSLMFCASPMASNGNIQQQYQQFLIQQQQNQQNQLGAANSPGFNYGMIKRSLSQGSEHDPLASTRVMTGDDTDRDDDENDVSMAVVDEGYSQYVTSSPRA